MGSGPGSVQRFVLARAAELGPNDYLTAAELAEELYGARTRPRVESVRRAIRTLADRGEVDAEYVLRRGTVVLAIRGRA